MDSDILEPVPIHRRERCDRLRLVARANEQVRCRISLQPVSICFRQHRAAGSSLHRAVALPTCPHKAPPIGIFIKGVRNPYHQICQNCADWPDIRTTVHVWPPLLARFSGQCGTDSVPPDLARHVPYAVGDGAMSSLRPQSLIGSQDTPYSVARCRWPRLEQMIHPATSSSRSARYSVSFDFQPRGCMTTHAAVKSPLLCPRYCANRSSSALMAPPDRLAHSGDLTISCGSAIKLPRSSRPLILSLLRAIAPLEQLLCPFHRGRI